jgi:hypothetical protein
MVRNQNKGLKKYSDNERKQIFINCWEECITQLKDLININIEKIKEDKLTRIKNYY